MKNIHFDFILACYLDIQSFDLLQKALTKLHQIGFFSQTSL